MMTALFIFVYLIGCVLAYVLIKQDLKHILGNWTIGDRKLAIFISLFSWASALAVFIKMDNNKPASW